MHNKFLDRLAPFRTSPFAIGHRSSPFLEVFDSAQLGWHLIGKCADIPMDFADAWLVPLAELHTNTRVRAADSDFVFTGKRANNSSLDFPGDLRKLNFTRVSNCFQTLIRP